MKKITIKILTYIISGLFFFALGFLSYKYSPSILNKLDKNKTEQSQTNEEEEKEKVTESTPDNKKEEVINLSKPTLLLIYGYDETNSNKQVVAQLKIEPNTTLEEKLGVIAKELETKQFKAKIELGKIKEENGKKILTVNLKDGETKWSKLFQGSSGGEATQYKLIESFLQKQYKESWIDGVRFTYNGKPIGNNYEHIESLKAVNYR